MIEAIAAPGNGPPPHVHKNEDETLQVLDGGFEILPGKHLINGKPNALIFVPHRTIHLSAAAETIPRMLLIYTPAGIEGFFREAGKLAVGDCKAPRPPMDSEEIAHSEKAGQ
ncbi:MAG: hypothetical protein ACJ70U_05710 [Nitrososphaera sp.]